MIYLMRHGELEFPQEKSFIGQTDLPLNTKGVEQAEWWNKQFAEANITFEKIYSSDLVRCYKTARIVGGESRVYPLKPLREIHLGTWEGVPFKDVRSKYFKEWKERGENFSGFRPPGGESFSDLYDRVIPAFTDILEQTQHNALIVAHGGVNRMILCYLLDVSVGGLFRIAQEYGCLNIIDNEKDPIQIVSMNIRPLSSPFERDFMY